MRLHSRSPGARIAGPARPSAPRPHCQCSQCMRWQRRSSRPLDSRAGTSRTGCSCLRHSTCVAALDAPSSMPPSEKVCSHSASVLANNSTFRRGIQKTNNKTARASLPFAKEALTSHCNHMSSSGHRKDNCGCEYKEMYLALLSGRSPVQPISGRFAVLLRARQIYQAAEAEASMSSGGVGDSYSTSPSRFRHALMIQKRIQNYPETSGASPEVPAASTLSRRSSRDPDASRPPPPGRSSAR